MLSRVADNLYWMSRYLERAEHTARLVDVQLNLSLDQSRKTPPTARWERLMEGLHIPLPDGGIKDEYSMVQRMAFDKGHANSIINCIASARENARQVREKISSEMWLQLNTLYLEVGRTSLDRIWNAQPHEFFGMVKNGAHLFQGITDSTMVHDEGWYFIQLGRFTERALAIANLMDVHLVAQPLDKQELPVSMNDSYFEWLGILKCFTAFEAYCKVYNADLRSRQIAEFLLFNAEFPHSLRFCAEAMYAALQSIAEATNISKNSRAHRLSGRLRSALSFDTVDDVIGRGTHDYLEDVRRQCIQIHDAVYEAHVTYPVESALS